MRYMEFWKTNLNVVISDPENPGVQSCAEIVEFPKYYQLGPAFWIPKIQCQIPDQHVFPCSSIIPITINYS